MVDVLSVVLALAAASAPGPRPEPHSLGVNLYIGDLSAVMGYVPALDGLSPEERERVRVRGHLLFAHDLLASVDTSAWPAARRHARATNLERLRVYAEAGAFPHNDDHGDTLRPTFVDRAGTICAVGALFAADRGRDAAVRIAADKKYAFVAQIDDPELVAWQQTSGLSVVELGLIQPTYHEPPPRSRSKWLPFGLLDRVQIASFRASVTTEVGSSDSYDTASLTLHTQASMGCPCNLSFYTTLPMTFALEAQPPGFSPAGGPIPSNRPRAELGTLDLGMFGGSEKFAGPMTLYRIGALLPTAAKEPLARFPSARVGDMVLELPRSAGMRISTSKIFGWMELPSQLIVDDIYTALRLDVGVDIAVELADALGNRQSHVIPRAGIGTMFARHLGTLSFDSALAVDPSDDGQLNLRWSAGVTGRLGSRDSDGWFMPALTIATVRAPDGWSGTVAIDLTATTRRRDHSNYD